MLINRDPKNKKKIHIQRYCVECGCWAPIIEIQKIIAAHPQTYYIKTYSGEYSWDTTNIYFTILESEAKQILDEILRVASRNDMARDRYYRVCISQTKDDLISQKKFEKKYLKKK